ncbi:MAG: DUF433 domain-containing protein, partial [Halobacteria archaeon]|nr:DUF433 domain-containing protein [Halobacteria archaeon]
MTVVKTEDTLGGEPRLEGRRVSVIQIADMVIKNGESPEYVADQLELGLDEVHEALAYYYRHPDEMEKIRERHRELEEELIKMSNAPEKAE